MPTNIRIRRGNKADLPASAPSGMPLWCEDTKELFMGTGTSVVNPTTVNTDFVKNIVLYKKYIIKNKINFIILFLSNINVFIIYYFVILLLNLLFSIFSACSLE